MVKGWIERAQCARFALGFKEDPRAFWDRARA